MQDKALEVLIKSREALERANDDGVAIADTIWYSSSETLFEYMDAEIERLSKPAPQGEPVADAYAVPDFKEIMALRGQTLIVVSKTDLHSLPLFLHPPKPSAPVDENLEFEEYMKDNHWYTNEDFSKYSDNSYKNEQLDRDHSIWLASRAKLNGAANER